MRLFEDDEDEEGDGGAKGKKQREKKLTLRAVAARDALATADGEASESDATGTGSGSDASGRRGGSPTYVQEQASIKRAFLAAAADAAAGSGSEGESEGGASDADSDAPAPGFGGGVLKRAAPRRPPAAADVAPRLLDAAFAGAATDPGDAFLKDYIGRRVWAAPGGASSSDGGEGGDGGDDNPDTDEDAAFMAAADTFEERYNFRFEEPGGATLATHPRDVAGVRRAESRRAAQRAAREARRAEAKAREDAEVRRLKSLKRREIDERLAAARAAAGVARGGALDALVADGEFDPAAHDAAMEAAFGGEYYDASDSDFSAGAAAEETAELLRAAGVPADGAATEFEAARARAAAAAPSTAAAAGAAAADAAADAAAALEEYYRLDAEDVVAGIRCRFKYRPVPAADYGLTPAELLALPDKELNQIVGLRRLAPYRDDGGVARPNVGRMKELGVGKWATTADKARAKEAAREERRAVRAGEKRRAAGGGRVDREGDVPPPPKRSRPMDPAAARLATFERPTIARPDRGDRAQRKDKKAQAPAPATPVLSKAARKNAKRAAKRAAAKA